MFKIITGYNEQQFFRIEADELHKAYFVFMNENSRTIFKNGRTLLHRELLKIEPDVNYVMGWLPDYKLAGEDFKIIEENTICKKMEYDTRLARDVAYKITSPQQLNMPMYEVAQSLQILKLN